MVLSDEEKEKIVKDSDMDKDMKKAVLSFGRVVHTARDELGGKIEDVPEYLRLVAGLLDDLLKGLKEAK